jgi:hypothetical protein
VSGIPVKLQELITWGLSADPAARPTLQQVIDFLRAFVYNLDTAHRLGSTLMLPNGLLVQPIAEVTPVVP